MIRHSRHHTGKTLVINTSMITGKDSSMVLAIDYSEFVSSLTVWREGALIQLAFPLLNNNEREFISTGVTPEEWKKHIG